VAADGKIISVKGRWICLHSRGALLVVSVVHQLKSVAS